MPADIEAHLGNRFAGRWILLTAINLRRIAILCFLVAALTAAYALTRTEKWEAAAVTMVPGGQSSVLSQLGGRGDIAGSLLPGSMSGIASLGSMSAGTPGGMDITVVQQVLSSRTVLERILLKYDLLERFHSPTMDMAMIQMGKRISVTLSPEGFLIVAAEGDSREEAAAMVNDMILFANEELATIITSRARRARIQAQESSSAAADSLDAAQERLEAFRSETGLIFPEIQGTQTMEVLGTLETQLLLAEAQLAGISGTMSPSSPAYVEIAQQVSYLRGSLEDRMSSGDSMSVFPGIDDIPGMLREYETIAIDVETRRIIYLMLRQELESLKLQEAQDSPSLEVLIPATPSGLRSYPKRGKMVVLNTMAAFILALLWLAVVAYTRDLLNSEGTGTFWKSIISISRRQLFLGGKKDRGKGA